MTGIEQNKAKAATDGDARLAVFATDPVRRIAILGAVLLPVIWVMWFAQNLSQMDAAGRAAAEVDFRVFWAAARLAYLGLPLDAFDQSQLEAVHGVTGDYWMPWLYPPGALILIAPLGALDFAAAWMVFTAISVVAMVLAVKPFGGGLPSIWLGFALAPAMFPALATGQTSVLWGAGLLAALAALRADKPVLAGVIIGLLTLKPQLGLLIAVALLASGAWRAILWSALTAIAVSALATLIVGPGYWGELLNVMQTHTEQIRQSAANNGWMISPYAFFAGLGLRDTLALALQWGLTSLAIVAVALSWLSPRVGFDLRAACLLNAVLICSPYLWFYESALLASSALFMVRAGIVQSGVVGYALLLAMWIGIGPAILFEFVADSNLFRYLVPPVVLFAFALCLNKLYHARASVRMPDPPSNAPLAG